MRTRWLDVAPNGAIELRVVHGNPNDADVYYRDISTPLGLDVTTSRLENILAYVGYGALTPSYLETTHPATIMAAFPSGDVLASRFFAPKITTVATPVSSGQQQPPPDHYGWRKLVRLRALPGSRAADAGIVSMFLLFNVFQPSARLPEDPFVNPSVNNQVILVRDLPDASGRRAYFLVYQPGQEGYLVGDHLCATFDGDVSAHTSCTPYYVPAACVQCHGGATEREMLNYLDTDHWNDRVQIQDDFSHVLTQSLHGVIFDGGRDPLTDAFARAFRTIRQINLEIQAQNCSIAPAAFQCRAVQNWLIRHASTVTFLLPIERPIPSSHPMGATWQGSEDAALLADLNRLCFRCHSSLAYHVFDKEAVLARRKVMLILVKQGFMPPDRDHLDQDSKDRIVTRLEQLTH